MNKEYTITSFGEKAPTELLNRDFYAKAIKPLSFQCRNKKDNSLQVYIAMEHDIPDIDIPDLKNNKTGCRVLSFYAILEEDTGYPDPELMAIIIDELTSRIKKWRNEAGEHFEFLWFDVNDFESIELIRAMGFMTIYEKIAYKKLNINSNLVEKSE